MRILHPQPLVPEAFRRFGSVISVPHAVGRQMIAELQQSRQMARPILGVSRIASRSMPLPITTLERHRHSSQTFIPMSGERCLILVSEGADVPDLENLLLFQTDGKQGVSYAPGIWHHPIVPIEKDATFATLIWKADDGEDEEFFQLGVPVAIDLAAQP